MRDSFPREAAANPEPFTGERMTAERQGQVELEHYHRYLFARDFCRGLDVLDVASGEGYGAAQLAQVAKSVVGVEYAEATARNAAANFPRANLRFLRGDARVLPLADDCIDVVTSFETIEHFDRQEDFVAEIRRVLRPDGCFIVSTPDRDLYRAPGEPPNEYHVAEFDEAEFLALLRRHFESVALVRQRAVVASLLVPDDPAAAAPALFARAGDDGFSVGPTLPKAPYLVAIASSGPPRAAPLSALVEDRFIDPADHRREMADLHDRLATALMERDRAQGSVRAFLRGYWPRLWRRLVG